MGEPRVPDCRRPCRKSIACGAAVAILFAALLVGNGAPARAGQRYPRNQASVADTVILPADGDDGAGEVASLEQAMKAGGLRRLDHVGIVDATVDANGCQSAPLTARDTSPRTHSEGLEAVADSLRRRGVTVTVISGQDVRAVDAAAQARARAAKGSFHLTFDAEPGRWLASKTDLEACRGTGRAGHGSTPHLLLAAMLAALHQEIVLAVGESQSSSKGADWNVIEGALSSSGKSLDAGTSQATIAATLVLENGSTPWSGEAHARGALKPPLDRQSVARLQAYMEAELRAMAAYRAAHPGAKEPVDREAEATFNSVASGNLDQAPEGATLGPSASATLLAAADRLVEQLRPMLPK